MAIGPLHSLQSCPSNGCLQDRRLLLPSGGTLETRPMRKWPTHRPPSIDPKRALSCPRNLWPSHWLSNRRQLYRRPVCRLLRALYGHPDSRGLWSRHCDAHLKSVGVTEVTNWRSVYLHKDLSILLAVYVDDFNMVGSMKNLPKAWDMLRRTVKMDKP